MIAGDKYKIHKIKYKQRFLPAPVSEVASFRGTTSFVMGGGSQLRPVWCPEADISLAKCATSAHERRDWDEVDEKPKIEVPRRRGVGTVLGDERRPRKRTSEGREVGESALSTKPLDAKRLWMMKKTVGVSDQ